MTLRVVADPHDETGLWWYDGYRRAEAWIARSDGWWHVPIREYAPYLAFGDRALLRYDNAHGRLVVFQRAPLPPLHARVATLASGRLPRPAGTAGPPSWSYENIDPQLAHQLAHSLASSLEIL
jgi:hypothetical protein